MVGLASPSVFYASLALFTAGAFGALLLSRHDAAANAWSGCLAIAGSSAGLVFASSALFNGAGPSFGTASSFPLLNVSFSLDPLSAFFMTTVCLVSLLASVYSLGYAGHYYGKYSNGILGCFYNVFIASMVLVVTAHNAVFFLIVWEVMSLASYFLVIYERRDSSNVRAGSLYFIMTHAGTVFIIISFILMFTLAGSFDFEAIRSGLAGASPLMKDAVFLTALVGFGTKAGIIPLHVWLPAAHPAAPSHVSALMSGVMIKTGIYMLIRIYFDMIIGVYVWWGLTLLAIGAISALLGVLYALSEHDLKRLLAYHSIENIGIILLGVGSALVFASAGMNSLAALSLAAALLHTLNHATFKALLFMGAGSVIAATGTRNIEKYGGLIKVMPLTALFFLIGSMAISALPPLNGFFSEWLTFQAMFQGVTAFAVVPKTFFILAIASLALTGGLAAACFVKAFGITFLARPRSEAATLGHEPGISSRLGMAGLVAAIAGLGLFAGAALRAISPVANSVASLLETDTAAVVGFKSVNIQDGTASLSMPAVFAFIAAALVSLTAAVYILSRKSKLAKGLTWDCGADLTPRMEITATGFARSLITITRGVLRPSRVTEMEYHGANRYFHKSGTVNMGLHDIYRTYIYQPLQDLITLIADQITRVQSGNTNAYILYIFFTLIGILFLIDLKS